MTVSSLSEEKSGLEQILDKETLSEVLKSSVKHDEIERKFFISSLPENLDLYEKEEIEQHYIPVQGKSEVRIRSVGDKHYITEKSGPGIKRTEIEAEISKETFHSIEIKSLTSLRKTRYIIPTKNGDTIELNIYKDKLSGLNVAEIEFDSIDKAESFKQPNWFSFEVTYDKRYYNSSLAANGKPPEIKLKDGLSLAKNTIDLAITSSNKPVTVLIAGGSGSGKTSFAKDLKAQFGDDAALISLDDYYFGPKYIEELSKSGQKINFDQPEALDLDRASADLEKLLAGETINKKIYDFSDGPYKNEVVSPHRVIIVEGLFALNSRLDTYGDLKIFIDTNKHDRLIRKLLRDLERTTWPATKILGYTIETGEPMYEKYIEPTKINADFIINSGYNPEIESKRANVLDRQVKFRISGTQLEYHERLRKLGAELLYKTEQIDTYYNARGMDITCRDEIVRIRREPNRLMWTYKGPKDGLFERRKLDIDTYPNVEEGLSQIYRELKQIKKTRFLYRLNGSVFSLDFEVNVNTNGKVSDLGNFLEFRLSSPEERNSNLNNLKTALNITGEMITSSYFEI